MPDDRLHLLFVCVQNSCRSQMAEAFAQHAGGDRVLAMSAGSRPSGRVHHDAIRFMEERGISLAGHHSKGLDALPAVTWDYVVTMGCGDACPHLPARQRLDWDLPDPALLDDTGFRAVRDRIESLVSDLVSSRFRESGASSDASPDVPRGGNG